MRVCIKEYHRENFQYFLEKEVFKNFVIMLILIYYDNFKLLMRKDYLHHKAPFRSVLNACTVHDNNETRDDSDKNVDLEVSMGFFL